MFMCCSRWVKTLVEECSCCVSSQQETDKWRRDNFPKCKSLKRTSYWPSSAPYLTYPLGRTSEVRFLFTSLLNALLHWMHKLTDCQVAAGGRTRVWHCEAIWSIFHKTFLRSLCPHFFFKFVSHRFPHLNPSASPFHAEKSTKPFRYCFF